MGYTTTIWTPYKGCSTFPWKPSWVFGPFGAGCQTKAEGERPIFCKGHQGSSKNPRVLLNGLKPMPHSAMSLQAKALRGPCSMVSQRTSEHSLAAHVLCCVPRELFPLVSVWIAAEKRPPRRGPLNICSVHTSVLNRLGDRHPKASQLYRNVGLSQSSDPQATPYPRVANSTPVVRRDFALDFGG